MCVNILGIIVQIVQLIFLDTNGGIYVTIFLHTLVEKSHEIIFLNERSCFLIIT